MKFSKKTIPAMDMSSALNPCVMLSEDEDEQIARMIKFFDLDPVSDIPDAIRITGDTRTDLFDRTNPNHEKFDPTYPEQIGGRRSSRAPRKYWTIQILRWRIRQGKVAKE